MNICDAIDNRRVVSFIYDGHARTVVPAAYGVHATTGNEVLRGYQIGGTSSSRDVPLWDLFRVDRIQGYSVTEETFTDDLPGYRRNDSHIGTIYCQL